MMCAEKGQSGYRNNPDEDEETFIDFLSQVVIHKVKQGLSVTDTQFYQNMIQEQCLQGANIIRTEQQEDKNGEQFTVYIIQVQSIMCHYETPKRYSEFRLFRKNLKNYFPDLEVPKFPKKNFFNKMSQKVIDKRLIQLNQFLSGLVQIHKEKNLLILLKFLGMREKYQKMGVDKLYFRKIETKKKVETDKIVQKRDSKANSDNNTNVIPFKPQSQAEINLIKLIMDMNKKPDSITINIGLFRKQFFTNTEDFNSIDLACFLLRGSNDIKGLLQICSGQDEDCEGQHLKCCATMMLLTEIFDHSYNLRADLFLEVFRQTPFSQIKNMRLKNHILPYKDEELKNRDKKCKKFALNLLRKYVDQNHSLETRFLVYLVEDSEVFLEYEKVFGFNPLTQECRFNFQQDNMQKNLSQETKKISRIDSKEIIQKGGNKDYQNGNDDSLTNLSFEQEHFSQRSQSQRENSEPDYLFDKLNYDFNQIQNLSNGNIKVKQCLDPQWVLKISLKIQTEFSLQQAWETFYKNRNSWDYAIHEEEILKEIDKDKSIVRQTYKYVSQQSGIIYLTFFYEQTIEIQEGFIIMKKKPAPKEYYKDYQLQKNEEINHQSVQVQLKPRNMEEISFRTKKKYEQEQIKQKNHFKIQIIIIPQDEQTKIYLTPQFLKECNRVVMRYQNLINLLEDQQNYNKNYII